MLVNDTIFLLDESLESLKRINEVQKAMDDQKTWQKQSAEDRQVCGLTRFVLMSD